MLYNLFIAMEIMLPWQQRNISMIVLLDGLFLTKSCAKIIASGASCYVLKKKTKQSQSTAMVTAVLSDDILVCVSSLCNYSWALVHLWVPI